MHKYINTYTQSNKRTHSRVSIFQANAFKNDWQLILVHFQTMVSHEAEWMNMEKDDLPEQYNTCPISLTFSEHSALVVTFL